MMNFLFPELEYFFRILCAIICGLLIGFERDSQLKMAGIRTHSIVALTSALIMIISKYGFYDVLSNSSIQLDPSRIGAGIVTAIGFLGAGVIFTRKQNVSGLTTAAGIWAVVGIGMAFGAGLYFLGVACTVCVAILHFFFRRNFRWIRNPVVEEIILQMNEDEDISDILESIIGEHKITISNIQVNRTKESTLTIKLFVKIPDNQNVQEVVKLLIDNPHIKSVSM